MKNTNNEHGSFDRPGEVRLERLLPGPIERIWEHLTDPEKRGRWFAGGPMELRPGGALRLHFQHRNLAPGERPPERYREAHDPGIHMAGRVLACEPPRLLRYTMGDDDSDVTFKLEPRGDRVLLTLTHRCRGAALGDLGEYAPGWHLHLAMLIALLEGTPPPPFWAEHARLVAVYADLKPAAG